MNKIVNIKRPNIARNTRENYQRALESLTIWLRGRPLTDAWLAHYITEMHRDGKSLVTISQLVSAVKWEFKHQRRKMVNLPITQATLAGIRRDEKGKGRGR